MLKELKVNDEFIIPRLRVPGIVIDGVPFLEHDLRGLKVKVINDFFGNKLCFFKDCLFKSCVSPIESDWENSALCKYLNTTFNDALSKVLGCDIKTNLLTEYEVFGVNEVKSNFNIPPKTYILGNDLFSFSINKEIKGTQSYWLGTRVFGNKKVDYSIFCNVGIRGYDYQSPAHVYGSVRPAFYIEINSNIDLNIDKYNKKLQVLKCTIDAIYQQNGITDYELDLFLEYFFATVMNKQFRFEYSDFDTAKNIKKLQDLKKRSIIYLNETINN